MKHLSGPRLLAGPLAALAALFAWAGVRQAREPAAAALGPWLHSGDAAALVLAAIVVGVAAAAAVRTPSLERVRACLASIRFWGWFMGGIAAVFLVLGVVLAGIDSANLPCRALCAVWLSLFLSAPYWPAPLWRRVSSLGQSRAWRRLELVAGNVFLTLALTEAVLAGLAAIGQGDMVLLNHAGGLRLRPGVYPNGLRANSLGFVGDEFRTEKTPGRPRIAALGDSFSVGIRVAYEDNYLTRVERRLDGPEVYNFGVCATGPPEYRILLSTLVWRYRPDMVLVPVFVGNDITERIPSASLAKLSPDALQTPWLVRRLAALAREHWRLCAEGRAEGRGVGLPEFSAETYLKVSSSRLRVCRVREDRDMPALWGVAEGELDRLFADCRAHNTPAAVLLLPDEFQVNPGLRERDLQFLGWRPEDVDVLLPQRRLAAFCAARGVPCLDLYPAFAEAGGAAYHPNDCHWNAAGNRLAAEAVAPWLRRTFPQLLGGGPARPPAQ